MEKINLHFTGDFHAITTANNMIAALLDNYIYQHQDEGFGLKEVYWRRVMDINDRSLRDIVIGIGPKTNGIVRETGFDITPASEIMAILCLAKDEDDLRERIDHILLGITMDDRPFTMKDMGVTGAIMVLLQDALKPNLVQTLEGTPAMIHGGPFANIAHGCNSILATKMAMTFGDYAITEAGFGADLGAEKFYDIVCRKAGLQPRRTIRVATIQGLNRHGGMSLASSKDPNPEGVRKGLENLDKHIENLQRFGQTVIVTLNHFSTDTEEEENILAEHCKQMKVGFAINDAFMQGGEGCSELAQLAVDTIQTHPSQPLQYIYEENDPITTKISKVAQDVYGAAKVVFKPAAQRAIDRLEKWGYGTLPVCIAKTQYSFSDDSKSYGVPKDFTFTIRDVVVNAGAGMIVAIAGDIMRMPGLPKHPNALHIDLINGIAEGRG